MELDNEGLQSVSLSSAGIIIPDELSCINCKLASRIDKPIYSAFKEREEALANADMDNELTSLSMINGSRDKIREFLRDRLVPRPTGDKNFLNRSFVGGVTLLHEAAKERKYDIIEIFLFFGADINLVQKGKTLAHVGAENNDTHLLNMVLSYDGDLSIKNSLGETPLQVAITFTSVEAMELLWKEKNYMLSSAIHESVLHYAARYNNISIAKESCNPKYKINLNQQAIGSRQTALHIAVIEHRREIVKILLNNGVRDNKVDFRGKYAFEYIDSEEIDELFLKSQLTTNRTPKRKATSESLQLETDVTVGRGEIKKRYLVPSEATESVQERRKEEFEKTQAIPLRQEIESIAIYDPADATNTPIWNQLNGFPKEAIISLAYPTIPLIPAGYSKPQLEQRAPKVKYPIASQMDYARHITLLNMAYSRKLKYGNRPTYKRDLYEIYKWERLNINREQQIFRGTMFTNGSTGLVVPSSDSTSTALVPIVPSTSQN